MTARHAPGATRMCHTTPSSTSGSCRRLPRLLHRRSDEPRESFAAAISFLLGASSPPCASGASTAGQCAALTVRSTTEGDFEVHWEADYFFGHNLAIATANNFYLDGLGAPPESARRAAPAAGDGSAIYLWMSDYHPDGGQLFWPRAPAPFVVCLGSK